MSILEEIRYNVFMKHKNANKCIDLIQQFDKSFFPCSPDETPDTYEEQLNEFVECRLNYCNATKKKLKISFMIEIPFFGIVIKFKKGKECPHFWHTIQIDYAGRIIKECLYCNTLKREDNKL